MTDQPESGAASPRRAVSQCVHMDRAGRVVVPAGIRKALNIRDQQELTITLEDDCIRLKTIDAGLKRIREIAKRKRKGRGSLVDEFIAERRAEAAQD